MSAKKRGDMEGASNSRHSKGRRGRGSGGGGGGKEIGRALRSVYDDTLREPVPDDFVNLIGKLK